MCTTTWGTDYRRACVSEEDNIGLSQREVMLAAVDVAVEREGNGPRSIGGKADGIC